MKTFFIVYSFWILASFNSVAENNEIPLGEARLTLRQVVNGSELSLGDQEVLLLNKFEYIEDYHQGTDWTLLNIYKKEGYGYGFSRLALIRFKSGKAEARFINVSLEGKPELELILQKVIAVGKDLKYALVEVGIPSSAVAPFTVSYVLRKCRLDDGKIIDVDVDFSPILE